MQSFPNVFDLTPPHGEYGIEVEVEAEEELPEIYSSYWKTTGDGSLRGYSAEYVMKMPRNMQELPAVLDELSARLEPYHVNMSRRTSIHVHMNTRDMDVRHVYNAVALFAMMEEQLIPKDRKGNMFCLRLSEAEAVLHTMRQAAIMQNFGMFNDHGLRYAAVNIASLAKYGSLEFRTMHGTIDKDEILEWVNKISWIKATAKRFNDPKELFINLDYITFPSYIDETKLNKEIVASYFHNIDWSSIVWMDEPLTDI